MKLATAVILFTICHEKRVVAAVEFLVGLIRRSMQMKRRDFLRCGVGLGLVTPPLCALANMMDHVGHGAMMGMDMPLDLISPDMLPSGQPLVNMLPKLANLSSEKGVFKATLVAEPVKLHFAMGRETEFWTYNGQLPGPQIDVFEGDYVEIEFINHLAQPTTVHWHGLDVVAQADGNPQDFIEPNGRKIYCFTLPKGSAGTYWYHPHPHGYVAEQVYMGLAGTLVVRSRSDPLSYLDEHHWAISDLRLMADGKIPANSTLDWMNGREGEIVLINGQYQPTIHIQNQQRIRIWNITSARYLRLKIAGVKWVVLGTEGGLLESPLPPQDELFLAPAERMEVMVVGDTQGEVALQNVYYDRHKMMVKENPLDTVLAKIYVNTEQPILPQVLRKLPRLEKAHVIRQVRFSERAMKRALSSSMKHTEGRHLIPTKNPIPPMMEGMFLINGRSFDMKRVDLVGKVNQVEEWEISNDSDMDHPFHLHGTQFEVVKMVLNGKVIPVPYRALKDVVNVRPSEKITIRFKQHHAGLKMFHCHILEHENLGMMGQLMVE